MLVPYSYVKEQFNAGKLHATLHWIGYGVDAGAPKQRTATLPTNRTYFLALALVSAWLSACSSSANVANGHLDGSRDLLTLRDGQNPLSGAGDKADAQAFDSLADAPDDSLKSDAIEVAGPDVPGNDDAQANDCTGGGPVLECPCTTAAATACSSSARPNKVPLICTGGVWQQNGTTCDSSHK